MAKIILTVSPNDPIELTNTVRGASGEVGGGGIDTSGTPVANDFARFTDADTIEGRSYAEVKADLDLEIGTDVQAWSSVLDATTASFTSADETKLDNISGTNTGDQTSIVGLTGTKAQFNTELSDGTFLFSGDEASIDHDTLLNFVANEHIDWTGVSAGTIDATNIPDLSATYATAAQGTLADSAMQPGDALADLDTTVTGAQLNTLQANNSGVNTGDETTATTSTEGIVELATQAEVDAGTDTSRVVTPDTLANYSGLGAGGGGAFSDASDPVVLNTTSKDVVIGAAQVNSAKFSIDGDADQVQLAVQGHAAQTANLMEIEASDGNIGMIFDYDGSSNFSELTIGNSNSLGYVYISGSGAGDATLDINGISRPVATDASFDITNSGAGAMELRVDNVEVPTISSTSTLTNKTISDASNTLSIEGTTIKSTGEAGGTKYLREDGDGTCSWQTVAGNASQLSDLSDVNTSTATNRNVLVADGVDFESRALVEADISDLGTYITASSSDTLTNKTFDANGTGNSLSNVDVADLANGTDGELITWDAAGAPATVAAGTANQVLTSNGAGAAPTFQDAAEGGAFTANGDTEITPVTSIILGQATGNETGLSIPFEVNKSTSGNATGLSITATDTLSPGQINYIELIGGGGTTCRIDAADEILYNGSGAALIDFANARFGSSATYTTYNANEMVVTDAGGSVYISSNGVSNGASHTNGRVTLTSSEVILDSPDGTDEVKVVNGTVSLRTANTDRVDITDSGVRLGAANARVTTILDEDTLSSNSETALATQQSIKAYVDALPVELGIAVSDETTDLTTGTAKTTFRMPYAMTLTEVRASVTTAPTGATLQVDINESGTTVLSTVLSIDATEKTSESAATAAVISDSALADDAEITIDIDQVGSTVAGAGLKIWLIGTRT